MEELLVDLLGQNWAEVLEAGLAATLTNAATSIYRKAAPGKWEKHSKILRYAIIGISAIGVGTLTLWLGGNPITWAVWGPMAIKAFFGALGLRQALKHGMEGSGLRPKEGGQEQPVVAIGRDVSIVSKLPTRDATPVDKPPAGPR